MRKVAALHVVSSASPPASEPTHARPLTRAECAAGPRPCPWVSCRHHLAIDVGASGTLAVVGTDESIAVGEYASDADLELFTDALIARMARVGSCALDRVVRDPDGTTLEVVGSVLDVTRERIRQIERRALREIGPRFKRVLGRAVAEGEADRGTGASGAHSYGLGEAGE